MADRLLLFDSDIFVLLSAAGMLDNVVELLGFTLRDTRRLDPLPHMLRSGRGFRKYSDEARASAEAQCEHIGSLTDRPKDTGLLDRLGAVEDIDVGEVLLFALLAEKPHAYLASGDKRAMIAVATHPSLRDVRRSVAGRVVCLEAALKLLVTEMGIAPVAKAFSPLREVSAALRVIFSNAEATAEADCTQALDSYLASLDNETGGGFLCRP